MTRPRETSDGSSPLDGLAGVTRGERVVIEVSTPDPGAEPAPEERDFEMPPQHVVDAKIINDKVTHGAVAPDPKVVPEPEIIPDPKVIVGATAPAGPALEPVKPDTITKFPLVENGKLPAPETVQAHIAGTDSLLKNDGISDEATPQRLCRSLSDGDGHVRWHCG